MSEKLKKEVQRQLTLKSEVTAIGPPYVAVNGNEILAAISDLEAQLAAAKAEVEALRKNVGAQAKDKNNLCTRLQDSHSASQDLKLSRDSLALKLRSAVADAAALRAALEAISTGCTGRDTSSAEYADLALSSHRAGEELLAELDALRTKAERLDKIEQDQRFEGLNAGWAYGLTNCAACKELTNDYWFDADHKPYCEIHAFAISRDRLLKERRGE